MGKGRTSTITLQCEKCGSSFHPWHNKRPGRFCSRACSPRGRQPTRPDAKCETCNVIFRPHNTKTERYCSRVCYRAAGGRSITAHGYALVYVPDHPSVANRDSKQVLQHRLVMEQSLGRFLESDETVHHINGDKLDNRIENLQLRQGKHGKGIVMRCLDCGSHKVESVAITSGG